MRRQLEKYLENWKEKQNRKPLILRGARQVGKTYLVRQFASSFDNFIELNLEKANDRAIFESESVNDILNRVQLRQGVEFRPNEQNLLFIDEIQQEPKAIALLRYFYEERPEIYVIAAGSLLEFALKDVSSMPVGRVEFAYLHPMNFPEYLEAQGYTGAIKEIDTIPLPSYAHGPLLKFFHNYAIIGGLPAIVSDYLKEKNLASLNKSYQDLWETYSNDVEKYAKNATQQKVISHIFKSSTSFLDRIKFEGFGQSNYKSREVGEAFRALDQAKIIQLVYPTTNVEPPISINLRKSPRLQFLDTGMLNNVLDVQGQTVGVEDLDKIQKGRIIQHLLGQELISIHTESDYDSTFWVRDKKNRSAEVDFVYQYGKKIIPIEVKSGKQGRLRSLHQFVDRCPHVYAVRMYAGDLKVEQHKTPSGKKYLLLNLPYFLGTKLPEYLEWFVENHSI